MRTTLVRTVLATTAVVAALGLTGCSDAATGSASVASQQLRNDAAQELAAARQATLVPVGTQVELLQRAELRARLAGRPTPADIATALATYQQLAVAIEAAPTASDVHTVVEQAGVDLDGAPVSADLG